MLESASPQSSSKRIKLESDVEDEAPASDDLAELDGDHCSICLQLLLDRTVIPDCSHEFCFDCILTWTEQSRRCPLCTRTIGSYLIHHIRSNFDYQKYHLLPLRSSPPPIQPLSRAQRPSIHRRSGRERRWGRMEQREQDIADELERAIDRRRWIYQNHLYAKHVASNTLTRYRPFPTPAQFSASRDYISRATVFIRRELRVWVNLDVEFLTTFILSLMKAIDIRSESAIKLLAEFLDMDQPYSEGRRFPNAEQFAHELYSFLRSPYKSLSAYDVNVQYDTPKSVYGRANHDNKTAPDTAAIHSINESTPLRSRVYRRSLERSSLSDGGDQFGPKLNGEDANDDLGLRPFGAPTSPYAEKHAITDEVVSSTPLDVAPHIGPSGTCATPQTTDDLSGPSRPTSPNTHPASDSLVKGKQRASESAANMNINDLATRITDGHGHIHKRTFKSPRSDEEAEDCQMSGNAPADTGTARRPTSRQTDDSSGVSPYPNSAKSAQMPSRSRNPLLIAQAHLSETRAKPKPRQTHLPLALALTEGAARPELRGPSQRDNNPNPRSLLSRITTESKPPAETVLAESPSQPGPAISNGKFIKVAVAVAAADVDPRANVNINSARRLEAEPAAHGERARYAGDVKEEASRSTIASQQQKNSAPVLPFPLPAPPTTTTTSIGSDASGPTEGGGRGAADPEEKQPRARARLRMKLTVAKKNLHASQSDRAHDRIPEKNPIPIIPKKNREQTLRAELENRRRGGGGG